MKVVRFCVLGLAAVGIAACAYASARLAGWVPVGKLAPYPAWVASHFVSATLFVLLAPLQLWPRLRSARPALHRAVGRVAAGVGAVMAVSGVAMVYASPDRPVSERIFMTLFFTAYLAFLALGVRAAVRRDIPGHRAWMIRMTATMFTPVTQRLIFPVLAGSIGIHGMDGFWQLFVSAAWMAWALNMSVAESWLGRGVRRTPREQASAVTG